MKTKNCRVNLAVDSIKELNNLIERIDEQFDNVTNTEIRTVDWSGNENIDVDFRCRIYFTSIESKIKIYKKMNQIKANPIKFIS